MPYFSAMLLGGQYPVMCVTLMNPRTGGVFASFGAHPSLEVALERSLTELLQGRSFEGLNDLPPPTFESHAVTEPNNFVEHFIDSRGVVSWRLDILSGADSSFMGTAGLAVWPGLVGALRAHGHIRMAGLASARLCGCQECAACLYLPVGR